MNQKLIEKLKTFDKKASSFIRRVGGGIILVATIIALGASIVFAIDRYNIFSRDVPGESDRPMREDPLMRDAGGLSTSGGSVATVVIRMLHSQYPAEPDIFKLDFSVPGDPLYGDNPEFEVFNPAGGNNPPLSSELFARFTDDPTQGTFIFTIANRIEGLGTDQSDLLAVLPNVKPEICEYLLSYYEGREIITEQTIDLTPFPNTVDEPNTIAVPVYSQTSAGGCLRSENVLYYVHSIHTR